MKEVLALIEKRKQEFAQLPFFQFLQDKSMPPQKRLVWAPFFAPFAMNFAELNQYSLRKEPATDKIQEIINRHTYEDDRHCEWFLEDMEKLNLNKYLKYNDALSFLWSKENLKVRQICHTISQCIFKAEPVVVLAAIEAIEATGNVALSVTAKVAEELQQSTKQEYRYFGKFHFAVETGHPVGTDDIKQFIESIQLTEELREQAFEIVEKVFEAFTEGMNELLVISKKLLKEQLFIEMSRVERPRVFA
ncbi:hypothetical protein [Scytonema sp. PCC 10023]|uniref:hypothetical protein n=1 Tax=Scytonema sp. PCC 10023 TaxID=1680591 RepID=UPI0039C6C4D1